MEKILMSGNEAIALGAYEAGVKVGSGYPGTPSTEILENLCKYPGVYTEWSVNEKVGLEVGMGAALSGARALVTMKHVGVNVAADPLFTASYIGVKGGLVVVTADDPGMHSSQNEQDNRHYARASKIPMLEPADSQEAKDFTKLAFQLSEKYDTPVFLRSTTRISHAMSIVTKGERTERVPEGFKRNLPKYVMVPMNARKRHVAVEERMLQLNEEAETISVNRVEGNLDGDFGIITSGVSYSYVREFFPDAAVLKLGMVFPLPERMIRNFCSRFKKIYIVEELEPFFEGYVRALGFNNVAGKEVFPNRDEFNPDLIRNIIGGVPMPKPVETVVKLPPRPPTLCPGCPHRTIYSILAEMDIVVSGDIGCYSLGALPPYNCMDTCIDMGAAVTFAQGVEMATDGRQDCVAVLGDSTFAHSGITGLLNAAYNKRNSVIIVLDNGTTAMTGIQPNPCSGETIGGEPTVVLDYVKLGEACGLDRKNIKILDAYDKEAVEAALKHAIAAKKLSLLVVKGPCIILRNKQKKTQKQH